jgi:hypothetical protein
MRRGRLSLPILVSFNELVWIFVFAVGLVYAIQTTRVKELVQRVEDDTKKEAALRQELEKTHREAINQQLVGLRGPLHRVVIVIDHSGSMGFKGKWTNARKNIEIWLRYLPIHECSLVIFNDLIEIYPSDGTFTNLEAPDGEPNRGKLLERLKSVKPVGSTNTLKALRKAYSYPGVDTIILFTDGSPDSGSNRFNRKMAAAVYRLCQLHGHSVPVNTVGLGSYSERGPEEFLLRLPRITGGAFFGR